MIGINEMLRQAIEDHDYLNKIGCDHDCMEIDAAVFDLMRDPTKKRALSMWDTAIGQWFWRYRNELPDDPRVYEIAERYGYAKDALAAYRGEKP